MSIITLSDPGLETATWQEQLRESVRSVEELSSVLGITLTGVPTDFPLLVPRPYLARIEKGRLDDPLLLQILPTAEENVEAAGYVTDPLRETNQPTTIRGLINKYRGRSLVIATGTCAINCRYCFRRHFPYQDSQPGKAGWDRLILAFKADPTIHEVILSGGDPLMLSDKKLRHLILQIAEITHIESIRLHTRLPVVLPDRICSELIDWVSACSKPLVFVLHVNHPREIDDKVERALLDLRASGATLLNQSVLLKGVNDCPRTLIALSKRLFSAGVLPYYLHLLDPVAGAKHFDVDGNHGHELIKAVAAELPGYLVPKLVREVPGMEAKQPYPPT